MSIKGIIFDKDGTLLKFTDIWERSFDTYLLKVIDDEDRRHEISEIAGIEKDGRIRANSIIASGTVRELAELMTDFLRNSIEENEKSIEDHFFGYLKDHPEKVQPTCDIEELFSTLKERGIVIGICTADSLRQTEESFRILGVSEYIDFIATGDVYPNKPEQDSLNEFLERFSLDPECVMMVGDSRIDMEYGRSLGHCIGVLTGPGSRDMLSKYTDTIVENPMDILAIIES